jgi:hypothetical protein
VIPLYTTVIVVSILGLAFVIWYRVHKLYRARRNGARPLARGALIGLAVLQIVLTLALALSAVGLILSALR